MAKTLGNWRYATVSAAFLTTACLLAPTARAEAADQATAPAATTGTTPDTLEEIVVTFERRSVGLQKTAVAATVYSGAELDAKGITNIVDLQFATPSLTIQDTGENLLVNIRGIGKSEGGIQDPSGVLIYRDGVSASPGGFMSNEPYYDLASVEVLRGPQGTLAGQNATGGALFIRENDPSLDKLGGSAELQYGNYDDVRFRGVLNIPVSRDFAIRIATNDERRNSFYNVSGPWTGNPGNHREADGRISFLWQPTDQLKIVLKNDFMYINHGGSPAGPARDGTDHLFDLTSDAHLAGVERGMRSVLQVSYDFDSGYTLRSIAGYQYARTSYDLDYDGTDLVSPAGPGPMIYDVVGSDRTVSEEINLISPNTGPLKWVVGGVYQNELVELPDGGLVQSAGPFGTLSQGLALKANYRTPIESWGIFGQATYELNDLIEFQLGGRYSEQHMSLTDDLYVLFNGAPLIHHPIVGQKESDSKFTGKANVNFHVSDTDMVYAFVATGHKSGGINPFAATGLPAGTPAPAFKPEEVTDYEIGWKSTFFSNHLRTQVGGFYNVYENYQVSTFDPTTGLSALHNATGTSIIDGVEAQAQAVFGALSLDFGAAYLNTELGAFSAVDGRFPTLGFQDLTGRQQPNAAHWTVNAGVQYAFAIGDATLTPRLDYGMVGSRWASVFAVSPTDRLAAQNLFNAQVAYDTPSKWSVVAYATNLFDLHYISSLSLGSLAQAGAPRQFGLRVSKSF
ncbi:TonB-dependent receptor [Nitrospirillum sp. BR 11163]|uniref:TonB-dependent receptor n=1 Tax=Nitrospirillum sp. BR 11163 TaxID=3104323 RepID=UPI002AFEBC86|nr:TonB-dependent receptor [Nitrospirillum sp. BR 11163]MEA1672728.1 TonB-dependent receptor [Nitrospirillum sp. BR 11163]